MADFTPYVVEPYEPAWLYHLDDWFAETFKTAYLDDGNTFLAQWTPELPFAAVFLYLVMVFVLPKLLPPGSKKDPRLPSPLLTKFLDVVMPLWNLGLSVISVLILVGVGLPYYRLIQKYGLFVIFCDTKGVTYLGSTGLLYWSYLFALSKYVELVDTLWLILKRRNVMFLHWFHHATVLLFTWFAEYNRLSVGVVFILVNAFVHTLMYFYYFVTALKIRVPNSIALAITTIQILQMFVGIGVNGYWIYLFLNGFQCACEAPLTIITSACLMYGTYLYLFVDFFVKRYLSDSSKSKSGGGRKPDDGSRKKAKKVE
eukprot:TRINITY_DN2936_c2_g1_i1.p1 TRINITY_DN2936_c2_g1~~TRINITY_DN2936_c2_g1_i1.p1  ORF type:complete len:348 (-),score=93.72 TRINITY_DN2936_c2_g1_i1:167-1108(-)